MVLIISHLYILATSNLLPVDLLELLVSSECLKENLDMEVDNNPIVTLFNYEFATWKPSPLEPEDIIRSRKEKTRQKGIAKPKLSLPGSIIKWLLPLLQELMFGKQKREREREGYREGYRLLWMVHLVFVFLGPKCACRCCCFWASAMGRSALPPPRKRPRTDESMLFATSRFFFDFFV
jgi:hypothetical protein